MNTPENGHSPAQHAPVQTRQHTLQDARVANCRIFLGNLASERTSKEELYSIFSKYGPIVEDVVMRRSFGFIQYDNPESALRAIEGENGRIIGGMRLGKAVNCRDI